MIEKIQWVHGSHPYYGHRRIALELGINKKCSSRIMRLASIQVFTKKRKSWIKTEDRNFCPLPIPNRTKEYIATFPNEIWRSDFTHLYYRDEVLHLATIIDEYAKEIVAYKLSFKHKKELIIETLDEAVKNQIQKKLPLPKILHSDQGSEYRSYAYQKQVSKLQILLSYSKKGSPWQNGAQESFYGKFKQEL
jgi:putative transposase